MFNPSHPHNLELLPPDFKPSSKTLELLADARESLSALKASLEFYENPTQLINIPALQESVNSSEIENIRTTVQGALEDSVKEDKDRKQGNKEALKYREALLAGFSEMKEYSLSTRTILKIHSSLDVKERGAYRSQQNKITNELGEDIYTPPPASTLNSLISNWEKFTNENEGLHSILRAIISHYQFEAIHPFADGNGRTGRILMVLQLQRDNVLNIPIFYVSGYLKQHSLEYKELLLRVTRDGDWESYINFMLEGLNIQALKTRFVLKEIIHLKRKTKREIKKQLNPIYSQELVNHIFDYPVTYPSIMAKSMNIDPRTASKYLKKLTESNFLNNKQDGRYNLYINSSLIKILFERLEKRLQEDS